MIKFEFSKITIKDFANQFATDLQCIEFLANEKWKSGFVCRKCQHTNYCSGKTAFSRRCTKCKHDESATAHTMFHRCKLPVNEAFKMAYEVCSLPGISIADLSEKLKIRHMTCWKLKKKIMECLSENQNATS
ncbi:MAG: transposase [Bacteroidales bacterium]